MSRIHEALKRAEEERNANQAAAAPLPPAAADAVLDVPELAPASTAMHAETGPAARAWSYAALQDRCRRVEWNPDSTRMLFFNKHSQHDVGMEEFRTLRSRLYRIREKRNLKTILVASALPAEGKSFVSANLSQVLARQHGRRVLLIDGDLRWSRLHQYLGTASEPGLTEYLKGECDEFSIIQRGPVDNLMFIPGGKSTPNPAELVANERFRQLVQQASQIFDWVVLDSPPAVPVSDAGLMSQVCDGVLLVVEAVKTPYEMAQKARQEFKDRPLLGVVLNRVAPKSTYTSYYYGRYGYGRQVARVEAVE